MSEEEYMECSVVAYPRQIKFLHINGGAISYYVDRHVSDYVDKLQQENQKYKEVIDKAIELLGNYKHYSTPDEKQNSDNEDLVNNALDILKEVE